MPTHWPYLPGFFSIWQKNTPKRISIPGYVLFAGGNYILICMLLCLLYCRMLFTEASGAFIMNSSRNVFILFISLYSLSSLGTSLMMSFSMVASSGRNSP